MRSDVVGQQNGSMASAQNANSTTEAELEKLKKQQEKKNEEALRVAKLQEQRMAQLEQQLKEQQAVASSPVPATEDPQPESKNKKKIKRTTITATIITITTAKTATTALRIHLSKSAPACWERLPTVLQKALPEKLRRFSAPRNNHRLPALISPLGLPQRVPVESCLRQNCNSRNLNQIG
jgi:hypothetical protein